MPIQGVSDIRRLPRIGKVRLGVKEVSQKSGKEFPKAVDYWVVNEDESTPAWAAKAFHQVYGERPRSLNIMLPVSERSVVYDQYYKAYGKGTGKICQGDGQVATRVNTETGEMVETACNPDECPYYEKKHCRRVASLRFLLPDVPGLGVWQWDSTSFFSIVNLNSGLDFVQAVAGRIHMIPLQLVVRPMEVQVEGKKKIVYIAAIGSENIRLADVARLGQVPENQVFLLDKPDDSRPADDLYPRSLVETMPEPAPAEQAVAAAATAEIIDGIPFDAPEPESEFDAGPAWGLEIDGMFDRLRFPAAKRQLWWDRSGQDVGRVKAELVKRLPAEVPAAALAPPPAQPEPAQTSGQVRQFQRRQPAAPASGFDAPPPQASAAGTATQSGFSF